MLTAATSSGLVTVTDFDANGNDTLRLLGFGFGGATTDAQRLSAIQAATTFAGGTATIDLDALGGHGDLRLNGVTALPSPAPRTSFFPRTAGALALCFTTRERGRAPHVTAPWRAWRSCPRPVV